MEFGGYRGDQKLVKLWADNCDSAMDWLLDIADEAGIQVVLDLTTKPWYFPNYPLIHVFLPDRQETLVKMLLNKALSLGTKAFFSMPALRLIREGRGKVTGIIARGPTGKYTQFVARHGVVLCTGDYGHDREMVARYCTWDGLSELKCAYNTEFNTGDGHKMAMWVGAAMDESPHCAMLFDFARFSQIGIFNLGRQPWLYVNSDGERFMNEDLPWNYECNQIVKQPGRVAWSIWDSKWEREVPAMQSQCCKNMGPPTYLWKPEQFTDALDKGNILSATSLEELARKMEVPVDRFVATAHRYTELARLGKDLDFGKHPDRLTPLDSPPFYACPMEVRYMVILSGLKINTDLQVLDTARKPIPGLYAAGNTSGGFFGGNAYSTTTPGVTHSRAWTFGRLAGRNAAGHR
jgi:fumarate reductase flavoprotein subunit